MDHDAPPSHLSPHERATLASFVASLRQLLGDRLVGTTLFGSRARGHGDEDSDLDVYVVVRDLTPADRRAVVDLACDWSTVSGLILSPLVRAPTALSTDSSLGRAIAADGIPL